MKLAFVDNLLFEDAQGIRRYVLQPHLGLISLIAVIERAGHEGILVDPKVDVSQGKCQLDARLYKYIAGQILEQKPDVVGLTSLGCNFICTAKVAGYLRQSQPDLPILLGGPHASVLASEVLAQFPQFDVIVRNEAERKILPLIEAVRHRDFRNIPGLTYRVDGNILTNPGDDLVENVDLLPFPAYHRYPVKELNLRSLRVDAGRGCPFQCTFCSTASFFGRKYRIKSAARLVEELDYLSRTYGITDFALTHDLFTVSRRKVLEFCEAVKTRAYTWKCSARMDCVDAELLTEMKSAGCRSIYFGIEAGTKRMQEISKKRLDLGLYEPTLDCTRRLGLATTVSFITGYPEESIEDQQATLDLIGKTFKREGVPLNIQLHLLTPEPGTELLHKYQNDIAYDGHISDFNFPSLESDDGQVIESHPSVFINHHFFPSQLPRDRHIFVTTVYQSLYSLGIPFLRHILQFYEGRFSILLEAMNAWRRQAGMTACADHAWVRRYFEEAYGSDSYLAALVRYLLEIAELRRLISLETPWNDAAGWDENLPLRLSPWTALLRGVPNCPKILESIQAGTDEWRSLTRGTKRYDFLLRMAPVDADEVQNNVLTPAAASLLDYFRQPRDLSDYQHRFHAESGYPAASIAFIRKLFEQGILVSAEKRV
jgi:radical SAM superfamily enzyme YgiQ (UPF0313 family)